MRERQLQQVEEDARHLADSLKEYMHEEGERMGDTARHLLSTAQEQWEQGREVAKRKVREADRFAHEHVWQTVAVAAVIGAVLAWLSRGRRDRG